MRFPIHIVLLVGLAVGASAPLGAQEQPRVVRGLGFEGNHALDDYTLSIAIATSNSSGAARRWWIRWLGLGEKREFDEQEFRRDVVRLLLLYRQSGYMNAVVDTVVQRTARDVFITFRIHEGEPVRLARLDILGVAGVLDTARLRRELPLQVGDPFNRFLFLTAADTILGRLRNAGHPYAEVLRSFDSDAGALRAEATLEAIPGPRVRIGAVLIEGLKEVDTSTVRRVLTVKPGDLYRQNRLYQSQRDLYGIDIFRSVNVLVIDSTPPAEPPGGGGGGGDGRVRVLVRLTEGSRHRIRFGAGYGTIDCFRLLAGWSAHDFLGGARTLDLTGRLSKLGVGEPFDAGLRDDLCKELNKDLTSDTVNYSAGLTLLQPAFLSPAHTASVGLFFERRSEIRAYTRQGVGFNVGITFNARRQLPVTLGYGYSIGRTTAPPAVYCSVFRVCDAADQVFLARERAFAAVTLTAVRDRVNSPLDPSEGSLLTATLMHASRAVGSSPFYEFNRGEVEAAKYYPIGRRTVFAWRVRGGTILPQRITLSGQGARFVPPEQRFYAGGPTSVRGYGRNELGPRVYVTDSLDVNTSGPTPDTTFFNVRTAPTGGNTAFVLNAELRLPSPIFTQRMRVGVFVDVGQVWEREKELLKLTDIRVTPGIGLRFSTPLGPVRLDGAYNDYPPEAGPLLYQDNANNTLTEIRSTFTRPRPDTFWKRLVLQFAVGQAF
ncbi:MAG: BamA/OMP85 family outer membrane protein [Gemmatimonadales bacterium]